MLHKISRIVSVWIDIILFVLSQVYSSHVDKSSAGTDANLGSTVIEEALNDAPAKWLLCGAIVTTCRFGFENVDLVLWHLTYAWCCACMHGCIVSCLYHRSLKWLLALVYASAGYIHT